MTDHDAYVDRLAEVAAQLVVRVRDDDPTANDRWLRAMLPNPADRTALCFVLAAAVPDDRSWLSLTEWTVEPRADARRLRPHGTHAAAQRHRYHGQPLCDACRNAEQARDRARKRAAYRASTARTARVTTPVPPSAEQAA